MNVYELRGPAGVDAWKRAERPHPTPGPGQVVVRVRAVSLNYRDLAIARGGFGKLPETRVPCSDGAGEIRAVGAGVTRWKPGDRVAATFFQGWLSGGVLAEHHTTALGGALDGMLAEQVVLSEQGLVAIPEHLSFKEAATLPCAALTAWNALVTRGRIAPGETILVLGTGGVSIFALQIARLAGARVIATSSSDRKLERARELGASDGINYKADPAWDETVKRLTAGRGVDHVIEVGGAGTLERSLRAVRHGGRVSLIGVLTGLAPQVSPMAVLQKSVTLQGIYVGSRDMFVDMNRALDASRLRPVVDRIFPFEEAPAALAHLEGAMHFGKIVVTL